MRMRPVPLLPPAATTRRRTHALVFNFASVGREALLDGRFAPNADMNALSQSPRRFECPEPTSRYREDRCADLLHALQRTWSAVIAQVGSGARALLAAASRFDGLRNQNIFALAPLTVAPRWGAPFAPRWSRTALPASALCIAASNVIAATAITAVTQLKFVKLQRMIMAFSLG